MKWLKIDYIKQHSRIDYDCEDGVLELYADGAEETILALCNRTYENLIGAYGDVPPAIRHASLMLVDLGYQHKSPVSPTSMSVLPYSIALLIKPYMILAGAPYVNERNRIMDAIGDQKTNLDFFAAGREDEELTALYEHIEKMGEKFLAVEQPTPLILESMRQELASLESDVDAYLKTIKEEG